MLRKLFVPSMDANTAEVHETALALLHQVVLGEQLDGSIAGPVDAELSAAHDAEPVFKADLRARVDAEEVLDQIAEIPVARADGQTGA